MTHHATLTTPDAIIARADICTPLDWSGEFEAAAHFTESGEWISDDSVRGGRRYWERTATLIGVTIGRLTLDRDGAIAAFGADLVDEWEVEAVE